MKIKGRNWFTLPAGSLIEDHDEENDSVTVHMTLKPVTVFVEDEEIDVGVAMASEMIGYSSTILNCVMNTARDLYKDDMIDEETLNEFRKLCGR